MRVRSNHIANAAVRERPKFRFSSTVVGVCPWKQDSSPLEEEGESIGEGGQTREGEATSLFIALVNGESSQCGATLGL